MPVKHHDGAWYAPPAEHERVEAAGQVALRYAENPNGALADVRASGTNAGNVCGLMPHREHAVEGLRPVLLRRPVRCWQASVALAEGALQRGPRPGLGDHGSGLFFVR